jgi:glucuronoarabinoxylan endo-1,4-beta-xylanase
MEVTKMLKFMKNVVSLMLILFIGISLTSCHTNNKPLETVADDIPSTEAFTYEVKQVNLLTTLDSNIVSDTKTEHSPYADADFTTPEGYYYKYSNIDYGTIDDRVTYYCSTIGEDKMCGVLLPPDYDESKEYPVVYLLHGFGGDHFDWNRGDCYVQDIYGNMLDAKTALPAIVVMPDMYTAPASTKSSATRADMRKAYDQLINDMKNDLMPYIESHYAVKTGRVNTAIIGTSQGGTESLYIGFELQDRIGYIGALAPCTGVIPTPYNTGTYWNTPLMDDFMIKSPATTPYYLQLTAGNKDPWCLDSTKFYESKLTKNKIAHTYYLLGDAGHEDSVWENGLYNFFHRIFR